MNEQILEPTSVNFLEANTNAITLEELAEQCVVPTWANQELTYYLGLKARIDSILANHCLDVVINSIKPIL